MDNKEQKVAASLRSSFFCPILIEFVATIMNTNFCLNGIQLPLTDGGMISSRLRRY